MEFANIASFARSAGYWLLDVQFASLVLFIVALIAIRATKSVRWRVATARWTLVAVACSMVLAALPLPSSRWSLSTDAPRALRALGALRSGTAPQSAPRKPFPQRSLAKTGRSHSKTSPKDLAVGKRGLESVVWLAILQAVAGLAIAAWLVVGRLGVSRLLAASRSPSDLVRREAARISRSARTRAASVPQPLATGVWRAWILLPLRVVERADAVEIRAALAHEWEHIRRGDLLTLALSRALLVVLFWNPAYWLLRKRLEKNQEFLADAAAVRATSTFEYAEHLLAWSRDARQIRGPVMAASASGRMLRERIEVVLANPQRQAGGKTPRVVWAVLAAVILLSCGVTFHPRNVKDSPRTLVATGPAAGVAKMEPLGAEPVDVTRPVDGNSPWTLTDQIQLVAIQNQVSGRPRWWRPEGAPLTQLPENETLQSIPLSDNLRLLFRVSDADPGIVDRLRALSTYKTGLNERAADIRIGVSQEDWTTEQAVDASGVDACGGLSVSPCTDTDDAVLTIRQADSIAALRAIAVDACGVEHFPTSASYHGGEWTLAFRGLPLDIVEEFVIQSRRETTIELRNVALAPDQRAEAETAPTTS